MSLRKAIFLIAILACTGALLPVAHGQSPSDVSYSEVRPQAGEGIWSLLRRSGVEPSPTVVAEFKAINKDRLKGSDELRKGVAYRVPVRSLHVPLFGKDYADVPIRSDQLRGHVYYIVSGHGGPDPGTLGTYQGKQIAEDEIAYDTSLRLARELMMDGATVYVIVQDPDDGIRDLSTLPVDHDEVYYGNKTIVLNQASRLRTRAQVINDLFDKNRKTAKSQQVISLHVDSYGYKVEPQVDVHFIVSSRSGKKLAQSVRDTIEDKYAFYQPERGYKGEIKSRNLMVLRETKPTAILIELGNIRHTGDQHRLVKPANRQTLAEWIKEGLVRNTRDSRV